jgi:hypothetical protein
VRPAVRHVVRAACIAVALLAGAAALTVYALEADDVAIVETVRSDASLRRTHVWFVRDGEAVLLEAGTPENGWYRDILGTKHLRIVEPAGLARECVPEVLANPDGHAEIRERLRAHYGWRDVWIALLFDTSRSLAVRCRQGGALAADVPQRPAALAAQVRDSFPDPSPTMESPQ